MISNSQGINVSKQILPVVPHKALAEVSKLETYRRSWLL